MQLDGVLLNELQLDSKLASCVQEQRRGEFALLLAMLSHDALDFAQFHLPKSSEQDSQLNEDALRASLGAGPKQPLAPAQFDMTVGQHNAQKLRAAGMTEIRLAQCLSPEPLAVRDDKTHVPLPVMDNCEPAVQRRHHDKRLELGDVQMNAAAFYDQLTDPALQEPLHLSVA